MPVKKRGKSWYVTLSLGGQRIRESAGKNATKEQALEIEARYVTDFHANKVGRKPDRLISEGVLKWLDNECKSLKSRRSMESHARALFPFIKGKRFSQISSVVEEVKRSMQTLLPATVNRRLAVLRRIANLAFDIWGWIDSPIGKKVKLYREDNARQIYLTSEEVDLLIASATDERVKQCIRIAAYTGLRKSEILGLTKESMYDGCIVLTKTKNGRARLIPLPLGMSFDLPIQISYNELRRGFERARKAIGRHDLHFHDLRHTYASWLIQKGAGLKAVQDLLGHSTIAVTGRYAHLSKVHLEEAVAKLGHSLGTGKDDSPSSSSKSLIGARNRSRTDTR